MNESRYDSENLGQAPPLPQGRGQAQNDLTSVGDISRKKVSQAIVWIYWIMQIFTIAAFVLWILTGVFKWGRFGIIGCVFVVSLVLSAIVSRTIAFYYRQMSKLGFVTEMVFILGVVFLVLNLILDFNSGYMLALFGIFSFVVSPVLGIIRRIILIVRKNAKSVRWTIGEMVILSIPVIIVVWLLLRFCLFDS